MTTALAASLIVCAHALGVLWRKRRPTPRDELIAKALLVFPFLVILGIGLVRQVYVTELGDQTAAKLGFIGGLAVFVVMNALIFVAAFAISYLHHDPETHGVDRVAKDVRRAERRTKRARRQVDRAEWLAEHFDNLKLRWEAAREGSFAKARFEAYRHKDIYEALIQSYWSANRTVSERRAQKGRWNWDRRRRQHGDDLAGPEPQARVPFELIRCGSTDSRRVEDGERPRERPGRKRCRPGRRLCRRRAHEAHHRVSRDPRRAAAVATAVACSILAVLASGCGLLGGSDKAEGAVLMLVDTSQSVQSEEARARYDEALETVLSAFREAARFTASACGWASTGYPRTP